MFISVSPHHPTPLYVQIVEQIRAKVLAGELQANDPLPSIRELAKELTTSVITTKRAYLELEKEGLIITRPGLGSFVSGLAPVKLAELKRAGVKGHLQAAIHKARQVGISDQEIMAILKELLLEEGDKR